MPYSLEWFGREVTHKLESERAQALAKRGVEVVAGDADDSATLEQAFAGTYAFCVTNFWEQLSAEREGAQATAMARATRKPGFTDRGGLIAATRSTSGVWLRVTTPPPRRVFTIRKGIDILLEVLDIDPSV